MARSFAQVSHTLVPRGGARVVLGAFSHPVATSSCPHWSSSCFRCLATKAKRLLAYSSFTPDRRTFASECTCEDHARRYGPRRICRGSDGLFFFLYRPLVQTTSVLVCPTRPFWLSTLIRALRICPAARRCGGACDLEAREVMSQAAADK